MTVKSLLLGGALAITLSGASQAASLVNAGFESGDLTGWNYSAGYVDVVTEADDALIGSIFGEHFTAPEGGYFAKLTAGPVDGDYTLLFQPFTLTVKSRISVNAAFLAFDYDDYNDDAYVRVVNLNTNEVFFTSSVAAVGNQGHTSWDTFTSGGLEAGDYVLEAGVRNIGAPDAEYSSQLLIDNVAVSVPEPGVWAMLVLGFGAVGATLRGRRRGAALRPLAA